MERAGDLWRYHGLLTGHADSQPPIELIDTAPGPLASGHGCGGLSYPFGLVMPWLDSVRSSRLALHASFALLSSHNVSED